MKDEFKLHDVVVLTEDLLAHNLQRGQVGTIVELWNDTLFEVEFSNNEGVSYAMVALRADQLIVLKYEAAATL